VVCVHGIFRENATFVASVNHIHVKSCCADLCDKVGSVYVVHNLHGPHFPILCRESVLCIHMFL